MSSPTKHAPTPPGSAPPAARNPGPRTRRHSGEPTLAAVKKDESPPKTTKAVKHNKPVAGQEPAGFSTALSGANNAAAAASQRPTAGLKLPGMAISLPGKPNKLAASPGKRGRRQMTGGDDDADADASDKGRFTVSTSAAGVPFWGGDDLELPDSPRLGAPSPEESAHQPPFGAVGIEALTSPFSPTKRLKAMTLRSAGALHQPTKSTRGQQPAVLSTTSHRVQQAISLWGVFQKGTTGMTFPQIVRKEFPTASEAEAQLILAAVHAHHSVGSQRAALHASVAERSWSQEEIKQLGVLFQTIDVDNSGSISRTEFLEIAALARLNKAELAGAFDAHANDTRRGSARTPGGSLELTMQQFVKLIESMDDEMLVAIRKMLPGLVQASTSSLLVFDDGQQQLWRLIPGGRALVRKPVDRTKSSLVNFQQPITPREGLRSAARLLVGA